MNRLGIEMSFGWIFSLIVGGAILFLAIYGVAQLGDEGRRIQQSFTAQELVTRLTTVTSSLETASRPGNLSFSVPTRIMPSCAAQRLFGMQELKVSHQSGLGEPWRENGIPARSAGMYVFSSAPAEGKTFTLLVKPILLPFKIGDSIALWSGGYCFIQPPSPVEEDLSLLKGAGNPVSQVQRVQECPRGSTVVCFSVAGTVPGSKSACTVLVDVTAHRVQKQGKSVVYIEPLLFAAIVSAPEVYECTVARILRRADFLAGVYAGKSALIASRSQQGCSSALQADLASYRALAANGTSQNLEALFALAQKLERENPASCPLWKEEM